MIIREIKESDARTFLTMLKKLDSETKYMMYEKGERKETVEETKSNIKRIHQTNSLLLIVEENEKIVGFLSAKRGFANRIKHNLHIAVGIFKSYRNKGIGTRLFERLEKWAGQNNVSRLELTVMTHNKKAIKLYKKMGFKTEGLKEKSLVVEGEYIDEYYMAKFI